MSSCWLARQPGIDARRLALIGYSQGGQVALLALARDAPVRAVVAYAAPSDLLRWGERSSHGGIRDYVATVCSAGPGLQARSPLRQVASLNKPVLLIHGDRDERVPVAHSRSLFAALQSAGKSAQLHIVPDRGHPLDDIESLPVLGRFLARELR